MTNRKAKVDPTIASVKGRINTITKVLAKVSVTADVAQRWDARRSRLHEAARILGKHTKPTHP